MPRRASNALAQQENASGATSGSQLQNSDLQGSVTQNSAGVSRSTNQQTEQQTQNAHKPVTISQVQHGPIGCCSFQGSNPNDVFSIVQSAVQKNQTDNQDDLIAGDCFSTGHCSVKSSGSENNTNATDKCTSDGFPIGEDTSPAVCSTQVFCEGGFCFAGGDECEESPRARRGRSG